nr:hypothetical protein [Tanacetum cinerariifolium]
MVAEDDKMSKEKEIDKLIALISLSFMKIYKPTNNKLRTSSNTRRANQDNTLRINKGTGYDNQRVVNVAGDRENVDDTNDEPDDQQLKVHYMYMEQIQEVSPNAADIFRPIFDTEPLQKVQNHDDNYNVFANDIKHLEQPEYVNDRYLEEQDLKKFQAKIDRYHDVNYALKVEIDCAKAKAPESDETIRLAHKSRSKISDLIKPFDYKNLNNLYDLFVPQREKSPKQRYCSERSKMNHTPVKNGNSKESFNKQTTLLEKRMDESISWNQKCKSSKELFKIKSSVGMIFDGVERLVT